MTAEGIRRRLHITPFTPDIADRILPPPLKALARDISFHSVETFPDKGFGYVDLPVMEADRLKKKLNGAVLKGNKVRIEEARPDGKKRKNEAEDGEEDTKRKKVKKQKVEKSRDVIEGFELPEGRRVKRGWEDKSAKKVKDKMKSKEEKVKDDGKSLATQKAKIKVALPLNVTTAGAAEGSKKRGKKDRMDKEKKGKKITIVDEFTTTHRPTAGADIVAKDGQQATEFDDEKGWVNADGGVVESAPKSKRPKRAVQVKAKIQPEEEEASSGSDISSVVSDDSSVMSSDSEEDGEDEGEGEDKTTPEITVQPASEQQTPSTDVHPLEALFKRTSSQKEDKPRPMAIDTSFSFFHSGADDEDERGPPLIPHTPHMREDMEWRQLRSAAPTPDTAAIGKKFRFPTPVENGDDVHMDDVDGDSGIGDIPELDEDEEDRPPRGEKEESEFRKWFYENRGDLNRSWKKRRREERKSKRQRENRRLSRRVV